MLKNIAQLQKQQQNLKNRLQVVGLVQKNQNYISVNLKQSYVQGLQTIPLQYKSIGQLLYQQADKYPGHQAVISHQQNTILSYQDLLTKSEQFAAGLVKLGLKKGDRVGIYSPNNYEWTVVQLAASLADLVLVNINPAYQTHELEYCLNKVNVKCLITADKFRKSNYIEMINKLAPELEQNPTQNRNLSLKKLKDLKWLIRIDDEKTAGFLNFQDIYQDLGRKDVQYIRDINFDGTISPDDLTNIQFTSGTTGSPKGAALTHFNILNNGQYISQKLHLTDKDKICIPVPLYHCFGMVLGNLTAINAGSAMVYPSDVFSAQQSLEAVTQYKCTGLYGVPTMFIEYFNEYEKNKQLYNVEHLRTGIMAGTLCPKSLMEKVLEVFKMKNITICYGMTETSPVSFQTSLEDSIEKRTTTVGQIHPGVEAKVVDEYERIVPINTPGELYVRGYLAMKGYFNDIERTNETIDENGWVKTGDVGMLDKEGYLQITGRKKDMIIRGGENVYPKEIEDFLMSLPGIQQAQVIGVPDEKYGEEIFAAIQLNENVDKKQFDTFQIYEQCRGTIAHFKIPKYVEVVDNYPLTVTGKVQKYLMKEQVEREMDGNVDNLAKYIIRKY